ncbi:hypothetical protein MUP79_04240, partial [Candidatus Bathyarchaeota archaeon]|nr:hypothetical protein [Candidatus Bathyarchaeota archaeon]
MHLKLDLKKLLGFSALITILTIGFLAVSLNIHLAGGAGGWWNTDWQYRRMITIDHTRVSADLANFPVLVNMSDSDLAHAQPDGRDIVFTDYYGNRLNHELESSSSSEYFIPFAAHAIAPAIRYSGNPVFGPSASGWDSVNVRDPTFLINDTGYAIQENGKWVFYYLGSGSGPSWGLGRAVTTDYIHWTREPDTMLLSIGSPGQWDDTYFTSGASVVKRSTGEYIVSYIGKDSTYYTGIGLANSSDGVHFTRFSGNPILNQSQFNILGGSTTVSMSYLYHLLNGTWVILFEASVSGGASCFGAMSEGTDPYGKWVPMNGGEAIFEGSGSGWDANDVCNPKLYEMGDGRFVLGYNGESPSNGYTLGWAYGTSLTSWTRYSGNPILGWGPPGAFDAVRVENTIVQKQQLENPSGDMILIYFACPGGVQVGDAWGIATIPSASKGGLSAWVNVLALSSTQDTMLYMYYGNPTCGDQQNGSGVWDSNYKMVQHLNEPVIGTGNTSSWAKYSGNPVLAPSGSDENSAAYASVLIVNGTYHMYYSTRQTSTGYYRIAHATSSDGKSWTKDTAHNPV